MFSKCAMKLCTVLILVLCIASTISAQEALLSANENYYDFLALDGYAERPYLNYRTLSDSKWVIKDSAGDIWNGNILGATRNITDSVHFRIYGPDLFNSFNTATPYGQNDGALWQGRGLNSSLTGGARLEAYGIEATIKPQICFSQNLLIGFVNPSTMYSGALYSDKADTYGYYGIAYIDAPQRFGNKPFFTFSWGDSEIRYTWKNITAGFGTQSVWLGPSKVNAIMLSNNAAPFPKADIGIRKTSIIIPKLGWNLGEAEARLFCGYLSESKYFDNDNTNDHTMFSCISFAFAPSILPGLSLFVNRSYLAPWKTESVKTLSSLFFINLVGGGAQDVWDQRASFGFDYLIPKGGVDVYAEIGINDYAPSFAGYLRYPFHSMVYTGGLTKSIDIPIGKNLRGELLFEWTSLEISQDFQFQWPSTFYAHHQMVQGYTNEGQWLAAGNGTGGNSQYLGFKLYHPKGNFDLYLHRQNPDNDYVYQSSINSINSTVIADDGKIIGDRISDFKALITFGTRAKYNVTSSLSLLGGLAYVFEINPNYEAFYYALPRTGNNFRFEAGLTLNY